MKGLKNKYYLLALVLIPFIVYLASILYLNQLKKPLVGLSIKGLQVKGSSQKYDVIDGEVLQDNKHVSFLKNPSLYKKVISLGLFYKVTKEDPLFTSQDMDYQKFAASIEVLADYHNLLIKKLKLKDNIIPLNFLESLPRVAEAHSLFIKKPTAEHADKLIGRYKTVQANYRGDLVQLINKLQEYFSVKEEREFIVLGSATSSRTILSDWRLMLKNASELKKEINYRQSIMAKGTYSEKAKISKPKSLKNYSGKVSFLNKNELIVHPQYLNTLRGPYIVETAIFKKKLSPEYYYVYNLNYRNRMIFMAKLATDNYYERLVGTTPVEKALIDKGYRWRPNWDGNTYHFSDNEWQVKLLTLDNFWRKYRGTDIFKEIANSPYFERLNTETRQFVKKAANVEGSFFAQKIPSETNLNRLKDYYRWTYELLKSEGSYQSELNADKERLLERYFAANSRLLGLDSVFKTTLYLDNLLVRANLGALNKQMKGYLYALRSSYSLTYLSFSPAVWRLSQRPKFIKKKGYVPEHSVFATYTQLRKEYSVEELLSWRKLTEQKLLEQIELSKAKKELQKSVVANQ